MDTAGAQAGGIGYNHGRGGRNGNHEPEADDEAAYAGKSGGAVGGTPAGKRSRGGRSSRGL